MLGWILRFLFVFLLFRAIWRLLAGVFRGLEGPEPRRAVRAQKAGSLVKDPVCGTYVSPAQALSLNRGGATHYFCSEECRLKFAGERV